MLLSVMPGHGFTRGPRTGSCAGIHADLKARVAADGKLIAAGSSNIDFARTVMTAIAGRSTVEQIQLAIEYDPGRLRLRPSDRATTVVKSALLSRFEYARRAFRAGIERAAAA
jgi:hypothetical protein